ESPAENPDSRRWERPGSFADPRGCRLVLSALPIEYRIAMSRDNFSLMLVRTSPMVGVVDAIDLRILEILQRDARVTQQEIARRVRLSQPSVADRIRKLEDRGVILGYIAKVDPA